MARRGDKTRTRLLEVATRLFAEHGPDAVSTREIARAAGTSLPSIPHYFDSKEGLYEAVLERVSEEMEKRFSAASAAALQILANQKSTRQQRLEGLKDVVCSHARAILQSRPDWASLITAEERLPTGAAKPIDRIIERQVIAPIVQLIASIADAAPATPEVRMEAISLFGSILIYRTRRTATLRLLRWPALTPRRIEQVVEHLRREVQTRFGRFSSQADG